jgi:hypothetical protein
LSPYNANGDFTVVQTITGLEMKLSIHWRKLPIMNNDYNFKKIKWKLGLEYKLDGLVLSSSMGFSSNRNQEICKTNQLRRKSI